MRAAEAHHNLRAQRERLGLAKVGAGVNVLKSYDNLNGALGTILGMTKGMLYNANQSGSS